MQDEVRLDGLLPLPTRIPGESALLLPVVLFFQCCIWVALFFSNAYLDVTHIHPRPQGITLVVAGDGRHDYMLGISQNLRFPLITWISTLLAGGGRHVGQKAEQVVTALQDDVCYLSVPPTRLPPPRPVLDGVSVFVLLP